MSELLTAGIDAALLPTAILSQFAVVTESALRVYHSGCLTRDRHSRQISAPTPVFTGSSLNAAHWHTICVLIFSASKQQPMLRVRVERL
ncbi:hypothetical protein [Gimesia maris]|uniref:hypothetical protein n=1 Tax=Gimesia maris TaxID=122 RepID=UPI0018D63917|nr:hypothetical protein [Gimesia maris]